MGCIWDEVGYKWDVGGNLCYHIAHTYHCRLGAMPEALMIYILSVHYRMPCRYIWHTIAKMPMAQAHIAPDLLLCSMW